MIQRQDAPDMREEKVYADKFRVSSKDLIKLAEMEQTVNRISAKFLFSDISEDNIKCIAYETTDACRQICNGHQFLDLDMFSLYEFAYMKVTVNNNLGTVELTPMFEWKGGVLDGFSSKGEMSDRPRDWRNIL